MTAVYQHFSILDEYKAMKIRYILFIFLQCLFINPLFSQNIIFLHQKEINLAYKSRQIGDWLTLVNLAKYAHDNQEDLMWQNGLIQWAEEIIQYKQTPAGARHLAFYYYSVGDNNKEYYWKNLADFWEDKREVVRKRMG